MKHTLTTIITLILAVAASQAQSTGRVMDYPLGTPDDDDRFLFAVEPEVPSTSGLFLIELGDLRYGIITNQHTFQPTDRFNILDSTAQSVLNVGEDIGVEAYPVYNLESSDGYTTTHYGRLDSLPTPCRIGSTASQVVPLVVPDTAETCFCSDGSTWVCWSDGTFDFTGELTQGAGESFTLRDSTSAVIFTVDSDGIRIGSGKAILSNTYEGVSAGSTGIDMDGFLSLRTTTSIRSVIGGDIIFRVNLYNVELRSSENKIARDYGSLTVAPLCNTSYVGSTYYDLNGDTSCVCDAVGFWRNEGNGPGPCL